jgi:hypothetical protein
MGRAGVLAGLFLVFIAGGCGERSGSEGTTSDAGAGAGSGPAGSGGTAAHGGFAGSHAGGNAGRPGGSAAEFFVESRVDGELERDESDVRAYWFQGLQQGYLSIEAHTDEFGWWINVLNFDGADNCGTATITLALYEGDETTYYLSDPYSELGHDCSIFVERAAPNVGDVIEGTFSGVLRRTPGDPNATLSVSAGAFRAPRIADGVPP